MSPREYIEGMRNMIESMLSEINVDVEDFEIAFHEEGQTLKLELIVKPEALMTKEEGEFEAKFKEQMEGL